MDDQPWQPRQAEVPVGNGGSEITFSPVWALVGVVLLIVGFWLLASAL